MKSFIIGVCIAACLIPIDAYAGCRKRFVRVERVVVKRVVNDQPLVINNYYASPNAAVVYPQAAPISVQSAVHQPVYLPAPQQVQQVAAVCCCPCPTIQGAAPPPAPLPGQPAGGPLSPPPAGSDVPAADASDQEIQAVATRACVSCHGDVNPKGNLSLLDVSLLTREKRLLCFARVMLGEMPPKNPGAVTDAEAQLLGKWAGHKTPAVP